MLVSIKKKKELKTRAVGTVTDTADEVTQITCNVTAMAVAPVFRTRQPPPTTYVATPVVKDWNATVPTLLPLTNALTRMLVMTAAPPVDENVEGFSWIKLACPAGTEMVGVKE